MSLPPPEALAGPTWFASGAHWPDAAAGPNLRCMLSRPPVWIRVQTDDPLPIRRELETLGLTWEESAVLPGAWRVGTNGGGADLTETAAFASGLIEVQDLGSQMILGAAAVRPGAKWLDACAGAGGAFTCRASPKSLLSPPLLPPCYETALETLVIACAVRRQDPAAGEAPGPKRQHRRP